MARLHSPVLESGSLPPRTFSLYQTSLSRLYVLLASCLDKERNLKTPKLILSIWVDLRRKSHSSIFQMHFLLFLLYSSIIYSVECQFFLCTENSVINKTGKVYNLLQFIFWWGTYDHLNNDFQRRPCLNSLICDYAALHGKRIFADMSKFRILR